MSADNGIYILSTPRKRGPGREYRVAHLQAVENMEYDWNTNKLTADKRVWIVNAREMWEGAKVYLVKGDALNAAAAMYDEIMESECPIVEYGIRFVEVEVPF